MKRVRLLLLAPAVLAFCAIAGAAQAVDQHAPPRMVRVPTHVNPVTKDQLIDAGAQCKGTACTFHGALWDCSNPQDCHVVKTD